MASSTPDSNTGVDSPDRRVALPQIYGSSFSTHSVIASPRASPRKGENMHNNNDNNNNSNSGNPRNSYLVCDLKLAPKAKLDELFFRWLCRPDARHIIDRAKEGKPSVLASSSSAATMTGPCVSGDLTSSPASSYKSRPGSGNTSLSPGAAHMVSSQYAPNPTKANKSASSPSSATPNTPLSNAFNSSATWNTNNSLPASALSPSTSIESKMQQQFLQQHLVTPHSPVLRFISANLFRSGSLKTPPSSPIAKHLSQSLHGQQQQQQQRDRDRNSSGSGTSSPGGTTSFDLTTSDLSVPILSLADPGFLDVFPSEDFNFDTSSPSHRRISSVLSNDSKSGQTSCQRTSLDLQQRNAINIPPFYFPEGVSANIQKEHLEIDTMVQFFIALKSKASVANGRPIQPQNQLNRNISIDLMDIDRNEDNNNNNNNNNNNTITNNTAVAAANAAAAPNTAGFNDKGVPTVTKNGIAQLVVEVVGLPSYISGILYDKVMTNAELNSAQEPLMTEDIFNKFYQAHCRGKSRESRLFWVLCSDLSRKYLVPEDFQPLLESLLICHPGLSFLSETPEFQQRYAETVIERIFYTCTTTCTPKLTLREIKKSQLFDTLMKVDEEEDINRERRFFSYEHFYVLYCRFWELDTDHDLLIDREDLLRYGNHSLTFRIVDRIFGGFGRPLDCPEKGYMSYTDFIWFCLSEEDKNSKKGREYWFRCVDLDGDGVITMFDIEYFYTEQLHRMECLGHEAIQLIDILCQILDMMRFKKGSPVIRVQDLKKSRLSSNFFNILFNLNKLFSIESRDPIQIRQEHSTPELTDWDRFAGIEYLRLSAEEDAEEENTWNEIEEGKVLMIDDPAFG